MTCGNYFYLSLVAVCSSCSSLLILQVAVGRDKTPLNLGLYSNVVPVCPWQPFYAVLGNTLVDGHRAF